MTDTIQQTERAISPSGINAYLSCQRKYWHRYVAKTEPDNIPDSEALNVGKAFHQVLEDRGHELDGLSMREVAKACEANSLDESFCPMIFAMLASYRTMHKQSGLKAVACEVNIDSSDLYGFVDVILADPKTRHWWIGDMKTASSYSKMLQATLSRHLQLNAYSLYSKDLAEAFGLDPKLYQGVRYRLTTKSKLKRKDGEAMQPYFDRLQMAIQSFDFPINEWEMDAKGTLSLIKRVNLLTKSKDADDYLCNQGNCTAYYRPCEYFSKCHGNEFFEA